MANNINDEFLVSYSKDFADSIISNLDSGKGSVSGKEIVSLTPSKQVNFFILMLLYGQWQDEMKKLESPYFNYKHEEVRKAMTTYMNVLSQHIEVSSKNLQPLIEEAIRLTINWLLFPTETLVEEINGRGINQVSGVKPLSRYYKIYNEDLVYLLNEKPDVELGVFLDEWAELMDQKARNSIIEKELGNLNGISAISLGDLVEEGPVEQVEEIEEQPQEMEADFEEQEIEAEVDEEAEVVDEESDESEDSDLEHDESEDDEPVTDEIGEGDEIVESDDSLNQQFATEEETLNDQYKDDQVTVAAKHQQKKISSILEAVSVNQEYMFTSELFGGDKETFHEAVEKIESCSSFDDSVEMLVENYAKSNSWDMNSVEVKELLKFVFRRFR
ncbi:MAG: hypothetical protein ACFHWX_19200 [Bacteroidota bacterium]